MNKETNNHGGSEQAPGKDGDWKKQLFIFSYFNCLTIDNCLFITFERLKLFTFTRNISFNKICLKMIANNGRFKKNLLKKWRKREMIWVLDNIIIWREEIIWVNCKREEMFDAKKNWWLEWSKIIKGIIDN